MADAQVPGNGRRIEKIATSLSWAAAHRIMTVFGVPLVLLGVAWLVARVEGMDAAFAERDGKIAAITQKHDLQFGEHERRIDSLEAWRISQERRR